MVLQTSACQHHWHRLSDDELWQCRTCGLQQSACPHPSWRRLAIGYGYACAWCGADPSEARDEVPDCTDDR